MRAKAREQNGQGVVISSIQWTAPSGVDQTNEAQNTNGCGLSGGLTSWLFAAEYAPATCWNDRCLPLFLPLRRPKSAPACAANPSSWTVLRGARSIVRGVEGTKLRVWISRDALSRASPRVEEPCRHCYRVEIQLLRAPAPGMLDPGGRSNPFLRPCEARGTGSAQRGPEVEDPIWRTELGAGEGADTSVEAMREGFEPSSLKVDRSAPHARPRARQRRGQERETEHHPLAEDESQSTPRRDIARGERAAFRLLTATTLAKPTTGEVGHSLLNSIPMPEAELVRISRGRLALASAAVCSYILSTGRTLNCCLLPPQSPNLDHLHLRSIGQTRPGAQRHLGAMPTPATARLHQLLLLRSARTSFETRLGERTGACEPHKEGVRNPCSCEADSSALGVHRVWPLSQFRVQYTQLCLANSALAPPISTVYGGSFTAAGKVATVRNQRTNCDRRGLPIRYRRLSRLGYARARNGGGRNGCAGCFRAREPLRRACLAARTLCSIAYSPRALAYPTIQSCMAGASLGGWGRGKQQAEGTERPTRGENERGDRQHSQRGVLRLELVVDQTPRGRDRDWGVRCRRSGSELLDEAGKAVRR
ncbi:hypothetical protein B0H14DRAFT_2569035 [Mycena olivaceomarginata]|nr:hypothetical protein B0H14DRAFT_2569035 [Mycena olivaceomarginata]